MITVITVILAILLSIVYILGALVIIGTVGLEVNKTTDLLKIAFWPIAIFICNK